MRIGISFLSFGKDVFAGIEHSLYNLARGLIANGCSVHVYSGRLSGSEEIIDGIPVYRSNYLPADLPSGDETVRLWLRENGLEITAELSRFILERQIDWLYVCDPLWGIVQLSDAWKKVECPMLLSFRVLNTLDLLEGSRRIPYKIYAAVSDALKVEICNLVQLSPFVILPNSVDTKRFRPERSKSESRVVFCNARISPEKGIFDLIEAFRSVIKTFPDCELWLCSGDFPFGEPAKHLREIVAAVSQCSLSASVRFLPKLAWDRIPEVINESQLVILPSHRETFGRAALEGMACGKPVIATRVGNLPALLGNAGILVEPHSPRDLASAMIDVLSNQELRSNLGASGVRRAGQFSNELIAAKFLNLIM